MGVYNRKVELIILFHLASCICQTTSLAEKVYELKIKPNRMGVWVDHTPTLILTLVGGKIENHVTEAETDSHSISIISGSFLVKAPPNHGLMTVVEELHLPQEPDGCSDFIRFEENLGSYISQKICGTIDRPASVFQLKNSGTKHRGPSSYVDPKGQTRVHTQIEYENSVNLPYVAAKLVFTAYKECPRDVSASTLARCSSHQNFSCIDRALFCDGRRHCAFEDDFGLDEESCKAENMIRYIFLGVLLGLVLVYLIYFGLRKVKSKMCDNKVKAAVEEDYEIHNSEKSYNDDSAMRY